MNSDRLAALGLILNGVAAFGRVWLGHWAGREKERVQSRVALARQLPSGSRIIDLGTRGVLIELGERGAEQEDAAR